MEKKAQRKKKPYEKPTVMRYPLRPEEAVLGFCKTSASSGPSQGTCDAVDVCNIMGS